MTSARWRQTLAVVLALAAASGLTGAMAAQGDVTRTLTILAARCPAGYTGDAPADQCDGNPMPGVAFPAGRPYTDFVLTARTDEAGIVSFDIAGLPLNGTLRVIQELPPETTRFIAYCVDEADCPLRIAYENVPRNVPPIGVADVYVGSSGDVRCDWYAVPMP